MTQQVEQVGPGASPAPAAQVPDTNRSNAERVARNTLLAALASLTTTMLVAVGLVYLWSEHRTVQVSSKELPNNCHASNNEFTCWFTNTSSHNVSTCVRGHLVQKKASGVNLESLVACSGRLAPNETRTVSAPWLGGFAKDICSSKGQFGNELLDWEMCSFTTEPVP